MKKPKLEFALIDAKDSSTVAIDSYNPRQPYCTNSKKNLQIVIEARREYLERLAELQKAIKDEFEPQMEPEPEEPDFTYKEGWAVEKEIDKKPTRNKNIDHLWYD